MRTASGSLAFLPTVVWACDRSHLHFLRDRFYVAGLSPYTLFKGTKSDFGVYNKIIDDDCQKQFAALSQVTAEQDSCTQSAATGALLYV